MVNTMLGLAAIYMVNSISVSFVFMLMDNNTY